MLNADVVDSLNCVVHLSGIIAIMRTQLNLSRQAATGIEWLILGTDELCDIDHKGLDTDTETIDGKENSIQSSYFASQPHRLATLPLNELVSILSKVSNLFRKATAALKPRCFPFASQLTTLKGEAIALRSELVAWYSAQPASIRAVTVERFTQPYALLFPDARGLTCTTLRADAYIDRE